MAVLTKICGICFDEQPYAEMNFTCSKCTYHICCDCVFEYFRHSISVDEQPMCPQCRQNTFADCNWNFAESKRLIVDEDDADITDVTDSDDSMSDYTESSSESYIAENDNIDYTFESNRCMCSECLEDEDEVEEESAETTSIDESVSDVICSCRHCRPLANREYHDPCTVDIPLSNNRESLIESQNESNDLSQTLSDKLDDLQLRIENLYDNIRTTEK